MRGFSILAVGHLFETFDFLRVFLIALVILLAVTSIWNGEKEAMDEKNSKQELSETLPTTSSRSAVSSPTSRSTNTFSAQNTSFEGTHSSFTPANGSFEAHNDTVFRNTSAKH